MPQLPCPGGVSGVCHSSVVALQGLPPAGLPLKRLQARLNRKTIWAKPTVNAITLMKGTSSDGGKTIEFSAEGSKMPLRAKFVQVDADRFTVTMSTTDANGKDMPFQETIYTRKK